VVYYHSTLNNDNDSLAGKTKKIIILIAQCLQKYLLLKFTQQGAGQAGKIGWVVF
jgi:hypothetical protein